MEAIGRTYRTVTAERAMSRALVLARRGMGFVRPNPAVGAVLVCEGDIVGEGYHRAPGTDHAEIAAIKSAGSRARGATLHVTLEPCNHVGRTPPCVPEIAKAGVARVVIAARDPNPDSGRGGDVLRSLGIEVVEGPRRREAQHLAAGFASLVERKRPRFSLKVATSLDGRIAATSGDSRWISSDVARAWAHRRRREADAILVGSGTVVHDNPALTTRRVKGRSPDRVVVDTTLRVPEGARVWTADGMRRIAATTEASPPDARAALESRGVEIWVLPGGLDGRVDLGALAARLGAEGYTNVLVEGGGRIGGALLGEQLIDVVWIVLSRTLLLGGGGPGWTEGLRVPAVARALKTSRTDLRPLGRDWLITMVPESASWWDPGVI